MQPTVEIWLPIVGYEGAYEVSNLGRVRSLPRVIIRANGRPQTVRGGIRKPTRQYRGHLQIQLGTHGRQSYVHEMVLESFIGPRPGPYPEWECRHLNGDPGDNRLANLKWGTRSENQIDSVTHGTNTNAAKQFCKHGHEFSPENTYNSVGVNGRPMRQCRTCRRRIASEWYAKRKASRDRPTINPPE